MPLAPARLALLAAASLLTAAQDACPSGPASCSSPDVLGRAALRQDVSGGDSAVGLLQRSRGKVPQAGASAREAGAGAPGAQVGAGARGLLGARAREGAPGPFEDLRDMLGDAIGETSGTVDEAAAAINDTLHDALGSLTGGASGFLGERLGDASLVQKGVSGPFDDLTDALGDVMGKINDTVDEAFAAINDTLHDAIENLTADTSSSLIESSVDQFQDGSGMSDDTLDAVKVALDDLNEIEIDKAEHVTVSPGSDSDALEGTMQKGSLLQTGLSDPLDDLKDGLHGIVDEVNKTVQTAISNISDAMQDALENLSDSTTDIYSTTDMYYVPGDWQPWQPWSAWQQWYSKPSLLTTGTRTRGTRRTVGEAQTPSPTRWDEASEAEDEQAVPGGLAPGDVLGWLRSQPFNRRTEEALAEHPLVKAAEAGTMPLLVAQLVLLEEYSIETSDLRSMAVALARHGGSPAAEAFFRSSVDSEAIAREKLVATARALGLSPEQLAAYEPMPAAHAYTGFLAELSSYGGMGAVAAGFAVNFPAYGRMCGRVGDALVAHHNLSEEDVGFFSWFAAAVPGFDDAATAVIAEGRSRNESLAEIRRGVRLLQGYELMFWDAVWAKGNGHGSMTVALNQ